jgi:hypothetical protein
VGLAGMLLAVAAFVVARPIAAEIKIKQYAEAYEQRRWAEAKSAAQAYLWLQPLDTEYWVALSKLSGDPGEAIAHQRRAVSLRPAYARYYTRLGWLYWQNNQPLQALAAFERAVEVDPRGLQWEPHQLDLGFMYAGLGRKADALAAFQASFHFDFDLGTNSIRPPDWYMTTQGIILHPAYTRYAATGQIDPALAKLIAYHLGMLTPEDIPPDPPGTLSYSLQEVTEPILWKIRQADITPQLIINCFRVITLYESFGDYRTAQAFLDEAKKRTATIPGDSQ